MKSPFGAAVYVSYAWGNSDSVEAVEVLRDKFDETFITFKPDKYTLQTGDSFSEFIDEIGQANCIIILFSEAYFESFYCMLELAKIIEHSKRNSTEDEFEGHLISRVISIQVPGLNASFINQQDIKAGLDNASHEGELVRLEGDETKHVDKNAQIRFTNIPYKSDTAQTLIVDNFDCFNQVFSKKLNYLSVTDKCFREIIQKNRQNYIRQLRGNNLFNRASASLCDNTCKALDSALQSVLSDAEREGLNKFEQKVACLLTLPKDTLLETLYDAQNSNDEQATFLKKQFSELLTRLLPLYCQQEYAFKIKESLLARKLDNSQSLIKTRYVLPISVENMMAAIDEREVNFVTVPISDISDGEKLVVDNKYCLYLSPESGDDARKTYIADTKKDLANSMGLSSLGSLNLGINKHNGNLVDTRARLLTAFTPNPENRKDKGDLVQNQAIDKALKKKALGEKSETPHRYFIVPSDDAEAKFWNEYAKEVHKISSKLVVLKLNTNINNFPSLDEEEAFFEDIPQLLNQR